MFHLISWREYVISLVILLAVYYVVVAAFCYRREIASLMKDKTRQREKNPIENNSIEDLEKVVSEVNGILVAAGKEADKSELLVQLKERLANFAGLRQSADAKAWADRPAYRVVLTNYIIRYAKTFCGVAFSEQELEQLFTPVGGEK
jgi:hypothetical protein